MRISLSKIKKIKEHAKQVFPEECCGLLIGKAGFEPNGKVENTVYAVLPCENVLDGDKKTGFEISLSEVWKAEVKAREVGLEIVGNYHSHTDAGAYPSGDDEKHCKLYTSMLIISLGQGIIEETKSWTVGINKTVFEETITFI
ncbi:MAG: M67 family metallopeptidase [Chloroherpetonaceae bacterium]|nr:M67 family metallopeptidase [Chloroherpetonaceae bacterium]